MIETERLLIRPYTATDVEAAAGFLCDAETMAFWPAPFTAEEASGWVARNIERMRTTGFGRCALVLKETGVIVGDAGVVQTTVADRPCDDLGYILHRLHWGRRLAIEAARALRDHYFAVVGVDAMQANMPWNHDASRRVAEKVGMTKVLEFQNPRNRGILTFLYEVRQH